MKNQPPLYQPDCGNYSTTIYEVSIYYRFQVYATMMGKRAVTGGVGVHPRRLHPADVRDFRMNGHLILIIAIGVAAYPAVSSSPLHLFSPVSILRLLWLFRVGVRHTAPGLGRRLQQTLLTATGSYHNYRKTNLQGSGRNNYG